MEKLVTIPKEIAKKGELVLIPRKEYEDFLRFRKQREWEKKIPIKQLRFLRQRKKGGN